MESKKNTAMAELIQWIDSDCTPMDCVMKAKELLGLEKNQIMNAWVHGVVSKNYGNSEDYYNEIYDNTSKF